MILNGRGRSRQLYKSSKAMLQSTNRYECIVDTGSTPFLVTRFRVLLCFLQQVSSKECRTAHVAYDEPFVSIVDAYHASECNDQGLR